MRIHERPAIHEPSDPTSAYLAVDGFYHGQPSTLESTPDRFESQAYREALANMEKFLTETVENSDTFRYDIDDDVREASLANFRAVTGGMSLEAAGVETVPAMSDEAGAMAMAGSEVYIAMPTTTELGRMAAESGIIPVEEAWDESELAEAV